MLPELKIAVLDFLETAHGYAIQGSIWPARRALLTCGVERDSEVYREVEKLIYAEVPKDRKPTMDEYKDALARAIEKVEAMR